MVEMEKPMSPRDDDAGPFDPDLTLADFSRSFLVRLGHEYLLIGHLLDRVAEPRPDLPVRAAAAAPHMTGPWET